MKTTTALIVGAGQAGLAMSRALTRRGVDHIILEKGVVANAWRTERWDSLRLLTPNWSNGLPGARGAGPDPSGFMTASAFADRLSAYAAEIGAPVETGVTVRRASRSGDAILVETDQGAYSCSALVAATGACAAPRLPALAADIPACVAQTNPARYKRPSDLPHGPVLVVGASASGVQIAQELQRSGRKTLLAVGAHTRLPRAYRGKDIEWWLDALGVLDESWRAIDDLDRARRTPSPQLIGGDAAVDLNALQESGVELVGRLAGVRGEEALFSGALGHHCAAADLKQSRLLDEIDAWCSERGADRLAPPPARPEPTRVPERPRLAARLDGSAISAVVWATGYRPDFSWLDLPVFDPRGRLRHDGGVVAPGVYALGLPLLRRRRSHHISGAGPDAAELADHLVAALRARCAA